jgi:hypothetical protein
VPLFVSSDAGEAVIQSVYDPFYSWRRNYNIPMLQAIKISKSFNEFQLRGQKILNKF